MQSYSMTISIDIRQRREYLTRKLLVSQETVFPPHSKVIVLLFLLLLLNNRNFLFYPATQANLTLVMHIVDYLTSKILTRNISNKILYIFYHYKLSYLIDIVYDNYFFTNTWSILDIAIYLSL